MTEITFQVNEFGQPMKKHVFELYVTWNTKFLLKVWRTVLLVLGLLVDSSSLGALWTCQLTLFWSPKFLVRSLLIILLRIPCMWWFASLLLISRFFLFFESLIIMCLDVGLWINLTWSLLNFLYVLQCISMWEKNQCAKENYDKILKKKIRYHFCLARG